MANIEAPRSQADTDSGDEVFRFTDLPAEIRNNIYSLVVADAGKVYNLALMVTPEIARASRQLRAESLPILFAEGEFFVNVVSNLNDRAGMRKALPSQKWNATSILGKCGNLRVKQSVKKSIRKAGNGALFKDITFSVIDLNLFSPVAPNSG